ncbi:copper amine oxidase N-terminal domain-containing protein [Fenollaria sporofastidiosus]|uniref:copper amine oxidase N-terminal domain-containing protein n=1 Tax=Fenollaria sporofastidiosus TaxID=2811778 RepID=UPI001C005D39|nr:copper amine oxidase N-terminal domain-containing protein [Fenollaria sporofastidiosus]
MKVKNAILSTIIATQILSTAALAAPDEAIKEFNKVPAIKQEIKHFQGEVKLFIIKDGEKVRVDQKMTDGLRVVNGRTCVGVRDLVNAIEGAKVEWDGTNHIVDITYADKIISYPVGKPLMWADGKAVTIDVPAQIDPQISKTFLPIRNIAETLGYKVDWDNKAKEVVLTPGAGTGITTTEQTKPTTTQNKNGKFILSSGEALPDFNNPPNEARYKLSEADFIDNGDGTETFAKGTPWEATLPKQYRRVESSPAHTDFKIVGNNGPDDRIGTYVFGQGEEYWEKAWNDMHNFNPNSDTFNYLNKEKNIKASPTRTFFANDEAYAKVEKFLIGREIKKEYVDEFNKKAKLTGSWGKAINFFKKDDEFYDATGIIDPSFNYLNYSKGYFYTPYFIETDNRGALVLTTDGRLFMPGDKVGEYEVDKILVAFRKKWLVIDVPNTKFKVRNPYKNPGPWGGAVISNNDNKLIMAEK